MPAQPNTRPVRTCTVCGCTEQQPCILPSGETCSWIDELEDLCSVCAHDVLARSPADLYVAEAFPRSAVPEELALLCRALRAQLLALTQLVIEHRAQLAALPVLPPLPELAEPESDFPVPPGVWLPHQEP